MACNGYVGASLLNTRAFLDKSRNLGGFSAPFLWSRFQLSTACISIVRIAETCCVHVSASSRATFFVGSLQYCCRRFVLFCSLSSLSAIFSASRHASMGTEPSSCLLLRPVSSFKVVVHLLTIHRTKMPNSTFAEVRACRWSTLRPTPNRNSASRTGVPLRFYARLCKGQVPPAVVKLLESPSSFNVQICCG